MTDEKVEYENQPKVYKSHPNRKGVIQEFHPVVTLDEDGDRVLKLGRPKGNFRPSKPGEREDRSLYSPEQSKMISYIRTR